MKLATETLEKIIEKFSGLSVGRILAESITSILEKAIIKKKLEDNYILIAIDDITRALGLQQIEWYIKWLYELLWKIREEYRPKAINIIVTTSEGTSLKLVSRHRHAHITLLWNLPKEAFKELFHELKPPNNTEFEQVWKLLGGNPGRLIELAEEYNWNLEKWLNNLMKRLKPLAEEIARRGLIKELKQLIEDPDNVWYKASPKIGELYDLLVENNVFMYKGFTTLNETEIPKDPELGIGQDYTWQIPAYRYILDKLLKNKTTTPTQT